MYIHTRETLARGEAAACVDAPVDQILAVLRDLSIDDFIQFMFSLPMAEYPGLSAKLPRMAAEAVQKQWAGASGIDLARNTSSFARQLSYLSQRHAGKSIDHAHILDFGCGFGRVIRALYYFTEPSKICGLDPWNRALDICKEDGLLGRFLLSDREPEALPTGDQIFDVVYAFSVFTHLSQGAMHKCLSAIRRGVAKDGLVMFTVRPREFWAYFDKNRGTSHASVMEEIHDRNGFAFLPHDGAASFGNTYGETTVSPDYLKDIEGWEFVCYDRLVSDPYHLLIVMRPA